MSPVFSVVVHVPHSCAVVPQSRKAAFVPEKIGEELQKMTDWYCDELFECGCPMLTAKVSRLVCDVERFADDSDEIMARKGMGFAYTRCSDGSLLRRLAPGEKTRIFEEYYKPHHRALSALVRAELSRTGSCFILDGHSFPAAPLPYEDSQDPRRPDFCIGTDSFHTPDWACREISAFLSSAGCSVRINSPFSGSIVPLEYYRTDRRVSSIMIEINRRLYMDASGGKTPEFGIVHELMRGVADILRFR